MRIHGCIVRKLSCIVQQLSFQENINIIPVAITSAADVSMLQQVATYATDVMQVKDFGELQEKVDTLVSSACVSSQPAPPSSNQQVRSGNRARNTVLGSATGKLNSLVSDFLRSNVKIYNGTHPSPNYQGKEPYNSVVNLFFRFGFSPDKRAYFLKEHIFLFRLHRSIAAMWRVCFPGTVCNVL